MQMPIQGGRAEQLRTGYTRLHEWISTTAPQFKPVITVFADPESSTA
jgi:hypothetical protein